MYYDYSENIPSNSDISTTSTAIKVAKTTYKTDNIAFKISN